MQTTQSPETLFGQDVLDAAGNKIGSVDGVWVDDATGALEFISVKTGWLMGKSHMIPTAGTTMTGDTIQTNYSQDIVKDAPSFDSDAELSPADEDSIYSYYNLDRSTSMSPAGLAPGEETATSARTGQWDTTTTTRDYDTLDQDRETIPLAEEELQVGKRQVQAGNVRLRKVVRTDQVDVPVELRREDVEIERVPVTDANATIADDAFQEREIDVPVMREEAVVGKDTRVTGQVQVNKTADTDTRTVTGQVRKEDVEVENDVDDTTFDNETDVIRTDTTNTRY
jgi:uncharacterized protein (TIGR02271 family)